MISEGLLLLLLRVVLGLRGHFLGPFYQVRPFSLARILHVLFLPVHRPLSGRSIVQRLLNSSILHYIVLILFPLIREAGMHQCVSSTNPLFRGDLQQPL